MEAQNHTDMHQWRATTTGSSNTIRKVTSALSEICQSDYSSWNCRPPSCINLARSQNPLFPREKIASDLLELCWKQAGVCLTSPGGKPQALNLLYQRDSERPPRALATSVTTKLRGTSSSQHSSQLRAAFLRKQILSEKQLDYTELICFLFFLKSC